LETSRSPWEARSEATDSSVGEGNGITPGEGSCRLARHQSLKHNRNQWQSVNSVKDGERGKRDVDCDKQVEKAVTVPNCVLKGSW